MGAMRIDVNASMLGDRFQTTAEQSYSVAAQADKSLAAAKAGVLTVRTSDTVGSLTMSGGHGILTAALIDLFWTVDGVFGARRDVLVGTVATNVVPISGGSGDNLPLAASVISAMVPDEKVVEIVGDDVTLIVAKSDRPGFIKILDDADAVVVAFGVRVANAGYIWYLGSGQDNPLAGVAVAKILTSHDDISALHAPKCIIGYE